MTDTQQPAQKSLWQRVNKLFLFVVALPTLISSVYFGLIASDVYISQSKFIIYSPQTPPPTAALGGLLEGVGFGNNSSNAAYAVHDYLLSRDALEHLQSELHYQSMVSQEHIDPFNRFGGWIWFDATFEQLYRYYTRMVADNIDTTTNISTLSVEAYSAKDAHLLNKRLAVLAQNLVNKMNAKANRDSMHFYQNQVRRAEARVQFAAEQLAIYRNHQKIFNPTPQAALQAALASKLQTELLGYKFKLSQMELNAPKNPQIPLIKKAIIETQRQLATQTTQIAGTSNSLASKSVNYERLTLAQTFANRELAAALTALEQARIQTEKQQLFIETIVKPNLPDESLRPRRLRSVFAVLLVSFMIWGILSVIIGGIREHHEK